MRILLNFGPSLANCPIWRCPETTISTVSYLTDTNRVLNLLNHAVGLLSDADELDDSIEQEIPRRRDTWPNTDDERNERWRLQLKYDLLVETSGGSSLANAIEFLESRYESIRTQSDELTGEQAVAIYLDSFCRAVDPHSGYFSQSDIDSYAGGPLKEYSIGLRITNKNGRAIIEGIGPQFENEPAAPMILGCELIAIRDLSGALHNVREIFPSTISRLVRLGLRDDMWVTSEERLDRLVDSWLASHVADSEMHRRTKSWTEAAVQPRPDGEFFGRHLVNIVVIGLI